MKKRVQIVEVGPRDGLQNEKKSLSLGDRKKLIEGLARAGLKRIEVGAFVSPKWVPQMAQTAELVKKISHGSQYSVLVPNPRGMEEALKTSLKEVAIFGACSESFSQKNINCSIAQSFERFREVIKMARAHKVKVRGYLSTAFGCPYEGKVRPAQVIRLAEKMFELGVYEVSIGDTIGVATPRQVQDLLKKLVEIRGPKPIAMHFHDTRGTALANVLASLEWDIQVFDSSVGGLGGCPYAIGASGNLATEDLVYMLEGMGIRTGIDLQALIDLTHWLKGPMGRSLPSRLSQAGLPLTC